MVLGLISTPKEQIQLQHLLMWEGRYGTIWNFGIGKNLQICQGSFESILSLTCCEGCINFFRFYKIEKQKIKFGFNEIIVSIPILPILMFFFVFNYLYIRNIYIYIFII